MVQNKDGEGKGQGHCDERMRQEFWSVGRVSILPVQCGRTGLAWCQSGHCAREEAVWLSLSVAQTSKEEAEKVCL